MERRKFFESLSGFVGGIYLAEAAAGSGTASLSAEEFRAVTQDLPVDERYWRLVRGQFLLPGDYVYLNTGGLGASPLMVINTVKEKCDLEDTYPNAGHNMNDWWAIKEKSARLFGPGCTKEELALTSTATEGINIVLNGLPLKKGDEVITSTHEHPALNIPLMNKYQNEGIEVRTFEPDLEDGAGNLDRIEALITRRTRLIFISHVTCTTGQIFPVREIGELARSRGIWFALDGVQAIAGMPLDVGDMGVDAYAVSGHKWILGPRRTGILYVREGMLETLRPTVVGAYSDAMTDVVNRRLQLQASAQRYEFGTQNDALFYGLGEAVDFVTAIGIERIHKRNRGMAERFVEGLMEIPSVEILSPRQSEYRYSMITFRHSRRDFREVSSELGRRRFRVRPVGEAGLNGVRVSFHLYNNEEEVERVLEEIRAL